MRDVFETVPGDPVQYGLSPRLQQMIESFIEPEDTSCFAKQRAMGSAECCRMLVLTGTMTLSRFRHVGHDVRETQAMFDECVEKRTEVIKLMAALLGEM